jgi:hypothetical protein
MVDIDAKSRYELLIKALKDGYAQLRSHGSKGHEIEVKKTDGIISITCKSDGNVITTYDSKTGIIDDNGAYTSFFKHLNHNTVLSVLKNAMAIEQAYEAELLTGPKPTRAFEKATTDTSNWITVDEPTRVKHKTGSDGKPLITLPIRRSTVESAGLTKDSWVVYSIKIVNPPDKTTRRGGEGKKCL